MERENWPAMVFIMGIAIVFGFFVYDTFNTRYNWWQSYLMVTLFGMLIFTRSGLVFDLLPLKRGNLIVTDSGLAGTVLGSPKAEHSGLVTYLAAFKRQDISRMLRKDKEGWKMTLFDWLSNMVTLSITAPRDMFTITPPEDIENQKINSMVRYHGRLDGGEIRYVRDALLVEKIKAQSSLLSVMSTEFRWLQKTLANISHIKTMDINEMSQMLQTISDRVKNVKIITKRGGSDIETIGGEMG